MHRTNNGTTHMCWMYTVYTYRVPTFWYDAILYFLKSATSYHRWVWPSNGDLITWQFTQYVTTICLQLHSSWCKSVERVISNKYKIEVFAISSGSVGPCWRYVMFVAFRTAQTLYVHKILRLRINRISAEECIAVWPAVLKGHSICRMFIVQCSRPFFF